MPYLHPCAVLSKCSRSYTIQRIEAFPNFSTCAFIQLCVSTHLHRTTKPRPNRYHEPERVRTCSLFLLVNDHQLEIFVMTASFPLTIVSELACDSSTN